MPGSAGSRWLAPKVFAFFATSGFHFLGHLLACRASLRPSAQAGACGFPPVFSLAPLLVYPANPPLSNAKYENVTESRSTRHLAPEGPFAGLFCRSGRLRSLARELFSTRTAQSQHATFCRMALHRGSVPQNVWCVVFSIARRSC